MDQEEYGNKAGMKTDERTTFLYKANGGKVRLKDYPKSAAKFSSLSANNCSFSNVH